MEGNPGTIADEGADCRLIRCCRIQVNLQYVRPKREEEDYAAGDCSSVKRSVT